MRFLALDKIIFLALLSFLYSGIAIAQEGDIHISQDPKIDKLLTFQKEINEETDNDSRLKIQIFNGNLRNAEKVKSQFEIKYRDVPANIKFETPNYKVWVGNFRTSLEAERYLIEVHKTFPNAFIFTPKKKKK
ncbi:SPOR domain-containing protein [Kordia zhangzhouensis]|uniref:SPOR domain-containing protein n=1 Tax=Kordia zhangzhouensis TaxID=1620405 RepID=UPI0006299583|nr:SPOR domain-containing protein [Kordia zhangzhouensis]